MNNKNFIIFDCETTGLSSQENEIIELAAVSVDSRSLEIKEQFNSRVKPLKPKNWSSKAEEIHGITLQDLDDAPHPKIVFKDFCAFVDKNNYKGDIWNAPIPVGHNVQFDLGFIDIWCKKYKRWDKNRDKQKLFSWMPEYLDTMHLMFYWCYDTGKISNLKLDSMIELLQMKKRKKHSALEDVKITAKIFCRFVKLHRNIEQKVTPFKKYSS